MSLALLLMTSLRGWYVTGHDVQTEYLVFELTKQLSRWKVSTFPDAYNACLSITILPTMILRWTRVGDPYVFKVLFQVLSLPDVPLAFDGLAVDQLSVAGRRARFDLEIHLRPQGDRPQGVLLGRLGDVPDHFFCP